MGQIGRKIKERREEIALSIDEVADNLKIRKSLVVAIEQGQISEFASQSYYLGYLKQYLKLLELEELLPKDENFAESSLTVDKAPILNVKPGWLLVLLSIFTIIAVYYGSSGFVNKKDIDLVFHELNGYESKSE